MVNLKAGTQVTLFRALVNALSRVRTMCSGAFLLLRLCPKFQMLQVLRMEWRFLLLMLRKCQLLQCVSGDRRESFGVWVAYGLQASVLCR